MSPRECQSYSDEAGTAGHSSAREIVAQRVQGGGIGDTNGIEGGFQVALQTLHVDTVAVRSRLVVVVVPAQINADPLGREDPARPSSRRALVLCGQGMQQVSAAATELLVETPQAERMLELRAKGALEGVRQHDDAVLAGPAVACTITWRKKSTSLTRRRMPRPHHPQRRYPHSPPPTNTGCMYSIDPKSACQCTLEGTA